MNVDKVGLSQANTELSTTQGKGKALSQDDFMRLFLTQMKTQSPMKPFDSSDMMQQMSQLTSLSATQELEKTIKLMNSNLGKSQVYSASQLIGKKVAVASEVAPLTEKQGLSGSVINPGYATQMAVEIKDSAGRIVKTINLPASNPGLVDFHWDGLGSNNEPLPADFYHLSAKAVINGETKEVPTAGIFNVDSVTMDRQTSNVILNVNGLGGTDMNDIIKIL